MDHHKHQCLATNAPRNTTTFPHAPVQGPSAMTQQLLGMGPQELLLGVLVIVVLQKVLKGSKYPGTYRHLFDSLITNILKTILGLILLAILLPIGVPVVVFFCVVSWAMRVMYKVRHGGKVTMALGMDSTWGVENNNSRPFITICLLMGGTADVKRVKKHLRSKVIDLVHTKADGTKDFMYKKFRQMFSKHCGYYWWRDAHTFNIDKHVRHISLSEMYLYRCAGVKEAAREDRVEDEGKEKGRSQAMDDLVLRYLSVECNAPMDGDRPPWEVLLLDRDDGRYNCVMRLHHAIGDGTSLARLCIEALVDTPLPPPPARPNYLPLLQKVLLGVWSGIVSPVWFLRVLATFDNNCLHGRELSGKKIMTWSHGIPIPVLSRVKMAASATVNDVLMSCLGAAFAKHFQQRSEDVAKVNAVIPVSFHDLQAPVKLTNHFALPVIKLPTSPALTPQDRLARTKDLLDSMKQDPALLASYSIVAVLSEVLPSAITWRLFSGRGVSMTASNVPGPQQQIHMWGDAVEDLVFWVPNRAPVAVGMSFSSYMGMVRVGLNIDAALVQSRHEAQIILENFEAEVAALHGHFIQGSPEELGAGPSKSQRNFNNNVILFKA